MPERVLGLVARLLGRELVRGLDRAPEERGLDRAPEERGLEGLDLTLGLEGADSRCCPQAAGAVPSSNASAAARGKRTRPGRR
jgi:hypothetical protein